MMAKAKTTKASAAREFDSDLMATIGRQGGQAGTGDAKRRTPEHYRKAAQARWDRYNKEKKAPAKKK